MGDEGWGTSARGEKKEKAFKKAGCEQKQVTIFLKPLPGLESRRVLEKTVGVKKEGFLHCLECSLWCIPRYDCITWIDF